jgi:hypothetical protein
MTQLHPSALVQLRTESSTACIGCAFNSYSLATTNTVPPIACTPKRRPCLRAIEHDVVFLPSLPDARSTLPLASLTPGISSTTKI